LYIFMLGFGRMIDVEQITKWMSMAVLTLLAANYLQEPMLQASETMISSIPVNGYLRFGEALAIH
jgi:hypothetical protein